LRRSTTRWTWPSDFNSSERSTVTFIAQSVEKSGPEAPILIRFEDAGSRTRFRLSPTLSGKRDAVFRDRALVDDKSGVIRRFRQDRVAKPPVFLPIFPCLFTGFCGTAATGRMGSL
jgi:hypothetical protein